MRVSPLGSPSMALAVASRPWNSSPVMVWNDCTATWVKPSSAMSARACWGEAAGLPSLISEARALRADHAQRISASGWAARTSRSMLSRQGQDAGEGGRRKGARKGIPPRGGHAGRHVKHGDLRRGRRAIGEAAGTAGAARHGPMRPADPADMPGAARRNGVRGRAERGRRSRKGKSPVAFRAWPMTRQAGLPACPACSGLPGPWSSGTRGSRRSSGLTAAGPLPIRTGFPIKSQGHLNGDG